MKNHETRRVYSPYRIQQLAVQAAIDSGDFAKASQIAMLNPMLFAHKPREPAQTGTIRNDPKQTDIFYRFGKTLSRIIKHIAPR